MKKLRKGLALGLGLLMTVGLCACGGSAGTSPVTPISYTGVQTLADMDAYAAETVKNGINNDDPVENGIVNCPYYELEINGTKVPVYTTRAGVGLHSFAWVDAEKKNGKLVLKVELSTKKKYKEAVVLPESAGVQATVDETTVKAEINDYGSFSFVFNKKPDEALTIYVGPKEEVEIPTGWNTQRLTPGKYTQEQTTFSETNTVYIFEAGRYEVSSICVPSESIVWFESGTYIDVYAESATDPYAAIRSSGTKDIKVGGRALFDFSAIQGGDQKIKGIFSFTNIDGAEFSGITSINSNGWTLCFTDSNDVNISRCMLLGYRTYSDGIMLSDCQDSGAKYCFLRTGDDAVETKSTGSEHTENILYEYNAVWTDKANAYGAIHEANNDQSNVVFRNCSVGFAQPSWSHHLGVCVVLMGDNRNAEWSDIHFENIEVYQNNCALINILLHNPVVNGGGKAKNLYFENITSKRCYGYPFRVEVHSEGTLGIVYLDNVVYNGLRIEESDIDNEDVMWISNVNNWSKTKNVKINTLTDE